MHKHTGIDCRVLSTSTLSAFHNQCLKYWLKDPTARKVFYNPCLMYILVMKYPPVHLIQIKLIHIGIPEIIGSLF